MKRFILSNQEIISFILLLVVCITLPLKNNINSLSMIIIGVFAAVLFILKKRIDSRLLRKYIPLFLFYGMCLVSVFYSEDRDYALKMIGRLVPFISLPLIFAILPPLKKDRYPQLMKVFIGTMVVLCVYSHTMMLVKLFNNNDRLYNIFNSHYSYLSLSEGTIGLHSTYYAYLIIIATIFVVNFLLNEKRLKFRILYFVIIAYFTFFVFHLSARLPIAVLFLFYNLAIIYYFIKQKQVFKGIIFLIVLYLVSGVFVYNVRITRYRFQQLTEFTYSDGTHYEDGKNKQLQWQSGIDANHNFLLGNGIGDANQSIYDSYNKNGLNEYAEKEYNAHNQYIQTYVGTGVLGLILLLFLFLYYFREFYKKGEVLGFIFLFLTSILYITESYLERQNGIVPLVFFICFFMVQDIQNRKFVGRE